MMKMFKDVKLNLDKKLATSALLTLVSVSLLGSFASAQSSPQRPSSGMEKQPCADNYEVFANTQIQTIEMNGVCFFSLHPRNTEHLLYRDFLFDSDGLMMIFDSYGQGSDSQATAAREFHFFPRVQPMSYAYNPDTKRLNVTLPSGKVFSFDAVKSVLLEISGTDASLTYDVTPANRGGLEIRANDGLFMDGGFARGHSPSQNSKDKISFKDRLGNSCGLANGDVYDYDSDGDTKFKFNDGQLKDYLASECPQLKL